MTFKKLLSASVAALLFATSANAQNYADTVKQRKYVAANQCFDINIFEAPDSLLSFDDPQHIRGVQARTRKRGLLDGLLKSMRESYQSTLTGQVTTTSGDIISSGIGLIADLFKSKRPDWMAQAKKECQFVKELPMGQEIHDFYSATTVKGAMDPDGILFNGFGCTQFYVCDGDTVPAFCVQCMLRRDEQGRNRILHHGKFEVEVKRMYVNPFICGLPNDSLQASEANLRIPFDFQRRKNLKITLVADVTSSWMNQAIQIYSDQKLGEFVVTLTIPDSTALEKEGKFKGWYVYDVDKATNNQQVKPKVAGECFIVPRSYIGTADGDKYEEVWGTGQYKINMKLSASCDINEDFYYEADPNATLAQGKDPVQGNAHSAMPGQQGNRK